MRRLLILAVLATILPLPSALSARPVSEIAPVAEVGPWPVASQLIAFKGRIWFVNSVKGVNHNSADLYSFNGRDPVPRFERSLFSQDAGDPVTFDGKLYWPLEDSRNSVGWAEVTVTDGEVWQRRVIPTAQSFHNHAMIAWRGELYAATSAWRAGLQASADGGLSWRQVYDHPTVERRVSRVVKLAAAEDFFLGHLIDVGKHRILRSDGQRNSLLDGWPEDLRVTAMAGAGKSVLLAANMADGIGLWRSDGVSLVRLAAQVPEGRVQDLQASGGRLWLLTAEGRGGALWSSTDGLAWQQELQILGGTPWDLLVGGNAVYIGGTANNGLAALWAHSEGMKAQRRKVSTGGRLARPSSPGIDWAEAASRLDNLLAEASSYRARATLRNEIHERARAGPPDGFFAARFENRRDPAGSLPLIGGQVQVENRDFADWLLLWGMGLTGETGVPTDLLLRTWRSEPNGAEKYFEPAPAALWAIVMGGQADRATIAALIERLGFDDDPDWLRNHVAGTLATLTGRPKHLCQDAWLDWWAGAEATWQR